MRLPKPTAVQTVRQSPRQQLLFPEGTSFAMSAGGIEPQFSLRSLWDRIKGPLGCVGRCGLDALKCVPVCGKDPACYVECAGVDTATCLSDCF